MTTTICPLSSLAAVSACQAVRAINGVAAAVTAHMKSSSHRLSVPFTLPPSSAPTEQDGPGCWDTRAPVRPDLLGHVLVR